MTDTDFQQFPHRRFNPLIREWVVVSPNRMQRPWLGRIEAPQRPNLLPYDPDCYLCPDNPRANGIRNPHYVSTYIFDNDYPALLPGTDEAEQNEGGLLVAQSEKGICRVLCFTPRHDLTIPQLTQEELLRVIEAWKEQWEALGSQPSVNYIQIFENRGAMMGASNPHPHCQIWTNQTLPNIPARELNSFADYCAAKETCLLCDYLKIELQKNRRVVCQNDEFAVVVPYWAVWPFETLVLSKRHLASMSELAPAEMNALADILRRITTRYDNLFETSCPYSMGFHPCPSDGRAHPEWHFHAHYFPPLLRSATVQKFMVGYELLDSPQRDMTAESAADRLIAAGEIHYSGEIKV